ncbi:lamin tail domain-containing protein [Streptomyces sp. NPDC059373]
MSRTAQRLAASVLASGALLAAAALPAAGADHDHGRHLPYRSAVALGAIQYESPGGENRSFRSLNAEWVTVTNTSRRAVDLNGWTLSNSDHRAYRFHHLRLRGHQSVRVHTGIGRDTHRDVYQGRHNYFWGNYSDTATLSNDRGRIIDSKTWGRHAGGDHGSGHGTNGRDVGGRHHS